MLLKSDPVKRVRTTMHYSEQDETLVLHRAQDVTAIIEHNKARMNLFDSAKNPWGEYGDWVGRIPENIYYALPKEIRDDGEALLQWLQDPANSAWKIRPGRLV